MEIWKSVDDFEGLYEVSNKGRVRSVDRMVNARDGYKRPSKGKIIALNMINNYLSVSMSKEGKGYSKRVHRLVLKAFVTNTENKPCVNHKNEIKTDNMVENLEWCTHKYNSNYKNLNQRTFGIKVNQYTLNGIFINQFNSMAEASRENDNICPKEISRCFKGLRDSYKGYLWRNLDLI